MKLNFQRQAGATLIEIIMVVALIAIITVGALVYFNSAQDASNVSEAVSGLTAMSAVVRNQYSTQGDYSGISQDVVMRFGNVPENMLVRTGGASSGAPTHLKHPWNNANGAVAIGVDTINIANDAFKITLTKVPAKLCTDLVTKTYRHFQKVVVGSTTVTNVSTATTACGIGNTTTADISFTQR
ncbi:type 4 pilus major pilin (plasmid) [Pseudomonas sp. FeN3W]|nr:type 4 pilus major pilin [Pseudomonas sp. FeN3W]